MFQRMTRRNLIAAGRIWTRGSVSNGANQQRKDLLTELVRVATKRKLVRRVEPGGTTLSTKGVTLALVLTISGVAAETAAAGYYEPIIAGAPSSYGILTTLRDMGLDPVTEPLRRGPYYVLHALDPYGVEVRVVADAQLGDILSFAPVVPDFTYVPFYVRAPRVIHVPENRDDAGNVSEPPTGDPTRDYFLAQVLRIPEDLPQDAGRSDKLAPPSPLPKGDKGAPR